MRSDLRTGQSVSVVVLKLLGIGLIVDLPEHRCTGLIRRRELTLAGEEPDAWQAKYKVGDRLRAVVIDQRDDGRVELSLHEHDSGDWSEKMQSLRAGQLLHGTVRNLAAFGMFVELDIGFTGLVHISHMPVSSSTEAAEKFWPGDRVKVVVESGTHKERQVELSVRGLSAKRWAHLVTGDGGGKTASGAQAEHAAVELGAKERLPFDSLVHQSPRTVLVVEDDEEQRRAETDWLRQAGQRVYEAGSGEEALDLFAQVAPDVVLMDFELPGIDGIETMKLLLAQAPGFQGAIMTDWGRADEHQQVLDELAARGVPLLLKPLLPADLLDVLFEPRQAASGQPLVQTTPVSQIIRSEEVKVGALRSHHSVSSILQRVQLQTGATKIILFSLDPMQRKVDVVAHLGREVINSAAVRDLVLSPVRDAAENGVTVRAQDVRGDQARFKYLLPLLSFACCMGVQVPVQLPVHYALFAFHTRSQAFQPVAEVAVEVAAGAIANVLERDALTEHMTEMQRLALLGQLARALVHEVNHRLTPVSFALDMLKVQCQEIDEAAANATVPDSKALGHTRSALDNVSASVKGLVHTARLFGRIARSSREQQVLVLSEIAEDVMELVADTAKKERVTLRIDAPEHIRITQTHVTLVQQILLNVVINAIQQISEWRPKEGGTVRIWFEDVHDQGQPGVRINVEDDGPGIHRRLWERIFDLGYTTRAEGSGLGLHISRSLAESLGGRVFVAESYIHWGTTFSIIMPLKL